MINIGFFKITILIVVILNMTNSQYGNEEIAEFKLESEEWVRSSSVGLSLDQLLSYYHDSIGGIGHMETLQSIKATGKLVKGDGSTFNIIVFKKKPNSVRLKITPEGSTDNMIIAYNGKLAWQVPLGESIKNARYLSNNDSEILIRDSMIFPYIFNYRDKGVKLTYLGMVRLSSLTCYKIKAILKDNSEIFYYLDGEKFNLRITAYKNIVDGVEQITENVFSNIKKSGNFSVSYKTVTKINGEVFSTLKIDDYKYDIGVFDSFFNFPGKRQRSLQY